MILTLTEKISKTNFNAFIWHGIFLSLASNFMDIHTIVPAMLIRAGGDSILLGLLTAIMMGGSGVLQVFFAGHLSNKIYKKNALLIAINLRVVALFLLSFLLILSDSITNNMLIVSIFVLISIFSFSGSYAGISYVDIMGKSILNENRKKFFSLKQMVSSVGLLISAALVKEMLTYFSYPLNYGILFLFAGGLLFIATLGFWRIKEIPSIVKKEVKFIEYFKKIPSEISKNSNLKNYLFVINNLGLGISFIPFMILYAKDKFGLTNELIGTILVFKIVGMLVASLILLKRSKKFDYKKLLYISLALGVLIPILSLVFNEDLLLYKFLFFLTGIFLTIYSISTSGILVEISDNENRASITGITGAGNILPMLFPLLAGFLISFFGYIFTFTLVSLIVSTSFIFIRRMNCKTSTL